MAGLPGLMQGGFTYTKDTQKATLGPLGLAVEVTRTVNVPVWAGVASTVVGGGLSFLRKWM